MASFLAGFLNAEAGKLGLAPSALIEKAVESYLRNAGYPIDEVLDTVGDTDQERKDVFLRTYASAMGTIPSACRAAAISTSTVYQWIGEDRDFASRFSAEKFRKHPKSIGQTTQRDMSTGAVPGAKRLIRGRRTAQVVNPDGSIDESGL